MKTTDKENRQKNTWTAKLKRTLTSLLPGDKSRKGKCIRCGACCRLPNRCLFLAVNQQNEYYCKIHSFRPLNCRKYPRTKSELITDDTCGFYFHNKENKNS